MDGYEELRKPKSPHRTKCLRRERLVLAIPEINSGCVLSSEQVNSRGFYKERIPRLED